MFHMEIDNSNALRLLFDFGIRFEKMPAKAIAKLIIASIQENFKQGGRPDSWEPRKHIGDGHPLLRNTDSLFRSFFEEISESDSEIEIAIDSGMPYAQWLNDGTKNMVARPFFLIQEDDEHDIFDLIADHLDKE